MQSADEPQAEDENKTETNSEKYYEHTKPYPLLH